MGINDDIFMDKLDKHVSNLEHSFMPYIKPSLLWQLLHRLRVPQFTLCDLGLHHYTNEWVGLLSARCGHCHKRVQVADPYSYEPHGGRNKYMEVQDD